MMATKGRESIVLDEKLLKIEAEEAIREVSFAVEHVSMSKNLPSTDELVYMNLRTKDGGVFCVELSVQGFRIVGKQFDTLDEGSSSRHFETIYALLDYYSPEYRNSFGDALFMKLQQLKRDQEKIEKLQKSDV